MLCYVEAELCKYTVVKHLLGKGCRNEQVERSRRGGDLEEKNAREKTGDKTRMGNGAERERRNSGKSKCSNPQKTAAL